MAFEEMGCIADVMLKETAGNIFRFIPVNTARVLERGHMLGAEVS